MSWVCPSCQLEFEPQSHDLARCQWQKESEMTILQYALIRAAHQVASESQRQILAHLVKQAEDGDRLHLQRLNMFTLELVQTAEKPRSKTA